MIDYKNLSYQKILLSLTNRIISIGNYFSIEYMKNIRFVLKNQYPDYLSIFLTTKCNLRCFICRRENFKGENLQFENIYKLEKAIRNAKIIELTGWGEALLYPKFFDALDYIESLNPGRNINLTTNGTLLNQLVGNKLKGRINQMTISLNAATKETYNRDMKGGDFDQTIQAIKDFKAVLYPEDIKHLKLHFVAHTENYYEIPQFIILASKLGISTVSIGNYLVGIVEHIPYTLLHVKEDYNIKINEAKKLATEHGITLIAREFFKESEEIPSSLCTSPFHEFHVLTNGDVSPCCFSGNYIMGNVYQKGVKFEDIWFGPHYKKLRKERFLPACKNCTPFIRFDDFQCHFTGDMRVSEEFKKVRAKLSNDVTLQ